MSELSEKLKNLEQEKQELIIKEGLLIEKALHSDDPSAIIKANQIWQQVKQKGEDKSKSYLFDPWNYARTNGYYERNVGISYTMLRRMAKSPIIRSIISTRVEQVAAFAQPQQDKHSIGFVIRRKGNAGENLEKTSNKDKRIIKYLTEFILECGDGENQWHGDHFDSWLRKVTYDSLELDQAVWEVIRNRKGVPTEFIAVDGATFRIADSNDDNSYIGGDKKKINGYYPSYVQVYNSDIVSEFYPWELCFGIRNPTTNINANGYGTSELEILVNTVTSMLYSDAYNTKFFSTGSAPKGILRVSGNVNDSALHEFRQQWMAQVAGISNSHKTPILPAEKVDWVDMQKTNRDMEFSQYQEYLIKVACAAYKMDPSEIGFAGGSAEKSMFEKDNEASLKYSKDKGLKPLLKFLQQKINKYIIEPLSPEFEFVFMGLDTDSASQELEMDIKKVTNFMTINEARKKYDLEPIDGGDIVLNSIFVQGQQAAMQGDPQSNAAVYAQQEEDQPDQNQQQQEGNPMLKSLDEWLQRENYINK